MIINRRKTRVVKIGNRAIGGSNSILIQSMTNTATEDVRATVDQIKQLERLGCEIVRVSVPHEAAAKALLEIKKEINIPLVADIHFDWNLAIQAINYGADKIRINPGNLEKTKLKLVVESAKKRKIPIRIGVNGGSLPKDILKKYGDRVTPEGLVESVENSINLIQEMDFFDIVVSMKSSDVLMTIEAHKILSQKGDWPLHVGVTEAGHALSGTVKSSLGIGALLLAGIGDTIRVSLTGDPQNEVKAAWEILKSLHIRERGLSIVSCPTCARTKIPVEKIVSYLERFSEEFSSKPIKIAVMGCIVNGLGEAKEADMAFVGLENKKIAFFRKGKFVANFDPEDVFDSIDKIMTEKNY
jgi:(E)-4-hydroxy-3-methylbut-2-enyl-diphosphate synthase